MSGSQTSGSQKGGHKRLGHKRPGHKPPGHKRPGHKRPVTVKNVYCNVYGTVIAKSFRKVSFDILT